MEQAEKQKNWRRGPKSVEKSMEKEESIEKLKAEIQKLKRNSEAARYVFQDTLRDRERLLLENEHLYGEREEAEKNARIDVMTGLPNLRSYQETIEREIERAKRNGHELAMIMIDIDDFKKINDTEGHDVGDAVIRRMSNIVRQNLRASDTIARVGGEEFIIILPETNLANAQSVANKLVSAVEAESKTEVSPRFTISGGLAKWNVNENHHILRENADRALNEAKLKGKNQILPFERERKIEKSELIAQAIRHIQRSLPKELDEEDRKNIFKKLLEEAEKVGQK